MIAQRSEGGRWDEPRLEASLSPMGESRRCHEEGPNRRVRPRRWKHLGDSGIVRAGGDRHVVVAETGAAREAGECECLEAGHPNEVY